MSHGKTNVLQLAKKKVEKAHFWSLALWWTYLSFVGLGLILAIAVPFGLAIMLYVPLEQIRPLTVWLLIASCIGLILQLTASVMRFRERAFHVARKCNRLEASIIKFEEGLIKKQELIGNIEQFLEQDYQEESP